MNSNDLCPLANMRGGAVQSGYANRTAILPSFAVQLAARVGTTVGSMH